MSRGVKERAVRIKAARAKLEQRLGREPALSEIAEETGLEPEEIAAAETATGQIESLSRETGDDGFTLEQMIGDYAQEERMLEHVALREAISRLSDREKSVISLRFFHGMTQDRAAKVLGVSQVQVSRIERRAIKAMREFME